MKISEIQEQHCAIARATAVVGDPWTLLVLRELFVKVHRFEEIQAYTGISPHLLKVRLRKLEGQGILERHLYSPGRHEYRLTQKGLDLWPVIMELAAWSNRWTHWPDGEPVHLRHTACGALSRVGGHCSECGDRLDARNAEFELSQTTLTERQQQLKVFRKDKGRSS